VEEYHGMPVAELRIEEVDWTHRGEHIRTRSARKGRPEVGVEPKWADEAVHERSRMLSLDPASKSHETIRAVGWSAAADRVLVVILLPKDRPPAGHWWGVNAWAANDRDRRDYWGQREG
jgi:hypothetical protein